MDSDSKSQVTAVSGDTTSPKSSVSSVELVEKYNNFKVDQLKKKLKELNLPITGKKAELIDRLLHSEQSKEENKTLEVSKKRANDCCFGVLCFGLARAALLCFLFVLWWLLF